MAFDEASGGGDGGGIIVGYKPTLEQVGSSHILASQELTTRP